MNSELPRASTSPTFDRDNSPLRAAYVLLCARTPLELSNLYSEIDQELMQSRQWDYANNQLITNQIKHILESIDPETLTEDEKNWRQEILWFWYHHAISCAVARYNDQEAAQGYARKALEMQSVDHPNQITRLLFYLVHDMLPEAEAHVAALADNHDEKDTAVAVLEHYKMTGFFK